MTMPRIKPNEIRQAQRFAGAPEWVDDEVIARYQEMGEPGLAADVRAEIDAAFDAALGESRR
jgi:hypothetical protein